jgi:CSLREA domain-containing protein
VAASRRGAQVPHRGSRRAGAALASLAIVVLSFSQGEPAKGATLSDPVVVSVSNAVAPARSNAAPTITEFATPSPDLPPYAITSGPDGALWFTYRYAYINRVGRISTSGVASEFCSYTGEGTAITSGPDGNLWITAPSLFGGLIHVAPSGACSGIYVPYPPFNRSPQDIVTGPDGALWFTEPTGNQIGRFAFLPPSPSPDPFPPSPFTFFDIPTPGSGVTGITRGPDGALWFTEQATDRIGRITTTGAFTEYVLPSPGSSPNDIAVGPDGALWFTERYGNRIGRITTAGAISEFVLPTPSRGPYGITPGPDGAMWFTEWDGDRIGRLTTEGVLTEITLAPFSTPAGITTGPDGNIWFTEYGRRLIGRVSIAAASIIVNSSADPGDGTCDLTECTLREAIETANEQAGSDVIGFDIAPGGAQTIVPVSPLPAIVDPVVLDATTQPGFIGVPLIELSGALAGPSADGLMVNAGNTTIRGLVINEFSGNGVFVLGGAGNTIAGNFIGTDRSGSTGRGNSGTAGILVVDSANNVIGGATPVLRNVIAANHHGVYVTGVASTGNVIAGNHIGTDVSGLHSLGNLPYHGIVFDGSSNNRVGGTAPGERNVISANGFYGIEIRSGFFAPFDPAAGNVVQGNYIGVDATGNTALGNGHDGVAITNTPSNIVGGTSPAARNVISGNPHAGVGISQAGATENVVQGNYIGTDASGSLALGNGAGVDIFGAANNVVGGLSPGTGNVISANGLIGGPAANAGVAIGGTGATGNVVQGNFIGTDASGFGALGNSMGVAISSENNLIGGSGYGARNVISGNVGPGVGLFGNTTTGNRIQGNFIGTSAYGYGPLGNDFGIFMCCGAGHNVIGGAGPGEGNTIASSRHDGISLGGACCNTIQGNYIGTNWEGTTGLGNAGNGVFANFASGNLIGGSAAGARNTISGNDQAGVFIFNAAAPVVVQGNWIGPTASGILGNGFAGVGVFGSSGTIIGGTAPGAGNVISGNGTHGSPGIQISNGSSGTIVQGNLIGTAPDGVSRRGNHGDGVALQDAVNTLVGGADPAARNVISGNDHSGVYVTGGESSGNRIEGNYIGTDRSGSTANGNAFNGIDLSGQFGAPVGTAVVRNVIAANTLVGIGSHDGAGGNVISGNFIGTNAAGTAAMGNRMGIEAYTPNNVIGGQTAADRNVISGNGTGDGGFGIHLSGPAATGNRILGNLVGTDVSGTVALPNSDAGVFVDSAPNNTIGGTNPADRNVISGGAMSGIAISTSGTIVQGNYIGTDITGTRALGNAIGVNLTNSANNTIGGASTGARNVISGNRRHGVHLGGPGSTGNVIQGNFIGTDSSGSALLSNAFTGVHLENGASGNTIGGAAVGAGNVISGTGPAGAGGIAMFSGAGANRVQGNLIGTDATGTHLLGIVGSGVNINTSNNLIGGTAPGARNVIVGSNCCDGITIQGSDASGNVVQGNYIGLDQSGSIAFGNAFQGIAINGATDNRIGGPDPSARNVIAGAQRFAGVAIFNGAARNVVQGNYIGTDASGTSARANVGWGVAVAFAGADNVIGGSGPGTGNLISGNTRGGVRLSAPTTAALVQGNRIGTTPSGAALGNGGEGVLVDGATNSSIGGTQVGAANVIKFNAGAGVNVISGQGTASGVAILGNAIASNGGLGIDLNADGVTENDTRDPDAGPNGLQNFPVVTSAQSQGAVGTIRGRLNSTANTAFRVEVFASSSCDPSGFGEGQTYLGSTAVTTNAGGNGTFALDGTIAVGAFITATATSPNGSSSEFAKCVQAKDATDSADEGNQ